MKAACLLLPLSFVAVTANAQQPRTGFDTDRLSAQGVASGIEEDHHLARALNRQKVTLLQFFEFTDTRDTYQCRGAMGKLFTELNDWSQPVEINTDNGWGGCTLRWALLDPRNELANLQVYINFEYGGKAGTGECGGTRRQEIHRTATVPSWTSPIFVNTDDLESWCRLTFEIAGRNDMELNVQFYPTDAGVNQCENRKAPGDYHTARVGQPAWVGFNTDSRYGGCILKLQLKKITP